MKFLYRCQLAFTDLPGTSERERRCDVCSTMVVNLDALTGDERRVFLERAATEPTTVCVSVTSEVPTQQCGGSPVPIASIPRPTMGVPSRT
jgi:hypothetical protein